MLQIIKTNRGCGLIDWILDLIDRIPDILVYVVPGFILVKIYSFVKFKDELAEDSKTEFVILKSIAISYIFKSIWDFAYSCFDLNNTMCQCIYFITMLYSCVTLPYVFYIIGSSKTAKMILTKLKIRRTANDNVWLDIIKDGICLRVFSKDGEKSYFGFCDICELHSREPIVVLSRYRIVDSQDNVIFDGTTDESSRMILNLSDFERVEAVQASRSVQMSQSVQGNQVSANYENDNNKKIC